MGQKKESCLGTQQRFCHGRSLFSRQSKDVPISCVNSKWKLHESSHLDPNRTEPGISSLEPYYQRLEDPLTFKAYLRLCNEVRTKQHMSYILLRSTMLRMPILFT
mmetsp:Transcript_23113/g.41746  ORF Transcript_23113/g.41746 Transcript_23113/m.41746 type:complete len:105 (-) Transcript_23113:736-1050(-)